ncbi:tRNA (adenosine(37)-N6)-threonylcarbamoyltransferase complex dimerization subunit type 1 TsaB [Nesterenkonia sp. CF4.4]|uniref:tRNA (adenosine(37)-N6)-threonylcarbamoyltransferase complex dimerization subunit type 1 TsaB n=1 Tax=Nesterenkonia sp. CF4.4 TaxID=3373079 RepID=UPI003EE58861
MILAIDSSAGASVAVLDDGQVRARWSTAETTTHAEVLAAAVAQTMRDADVTGARLRSVVVGVGPGPFTGLRVGLALAHSLAEVWGVPIHGVCSLDSLAQRAVNHPAEAPTPADGEFLAASDARRREVYWARYRADAQGFAELLDGPQVSAATELPDLPVVGVGASLYPQVLTARSEAESHWLPDAVELGQLAQRELRRSGVLGEPVTEPSAQPDISTGSRQPATTTGSVLRDPLPLYLRDSDAKVPAQMRAKQAS